jgi:hypothetical protein
MIARQLKLMLRAYNGECDAAVASVTWKNIVTLKERLTKSLDSINKLGDTVCCSITPKYVALKQEEMELAYEYAEKVQLEKEEKRLVREQLRRGLHQVRKPCGRVQHQTFQCEITGLGGRHRREILQPCANSIGSSGLA